MGGGQANADATGFVLDGYDGFFFTAAHNFWDQDHIRLAMIEVQVGGTRCRVYLPQPRHDYVLHRGYTVRGVLTDSAHDIAMVRMPRGVFVKGLQGAWQVPPAVAAAPAAEDVVIAGFPFPAAGHVAGAALPVLQYAGGRISSVGGTLTCPGLMPEGSSGSPWLMHSSPMHVMAVQSANWHHLSLGTPLRHADIDAMLRWFF